VLDFLKDEAVFRHFLAALTLLSRLGDVVSTWVASPTLKLEANPVVRKLGWKFGLLTLLLALVPYYNTSLGVMVLTMSCLVTSSNFGAGWTMRTLGEDEMQAFTIRLARRSTLRTALAFVWAGAAAVAMVGLLLTWLTRPDEWGYYFGWGIMAYAFARVLHGSLAMVRLFRRASGASAVPAEAGRVAVAEG
jgi:hypothetical protein